MTNFNFNVLRKLKINFLSFMKDLMVRGDPYNISGDLGNNFPVGGYTKCGRSCESCDYFVVSTDNFKCFATTKTYKIKRSLTCVSKYVVYLAFCLLCQELGVG